MTKMEISSESLIGDVIRNVPGGEDVIKKYFGNGCFTCPGMNTESIAFGSMMHGLEPEPLVSELLELVAA